MSVHRGLGKPFQQGNHHGKGRPPGSRNKAKLATEALLDGEGEGIMRKAIELAKKGNMTAIRLCLDRYFPARHERPIHLPLPEIKTAKDVSRALDTVLDAVGQGEITIGEGVQVASLLEARQKALEKQNLGLDLQRHLEEPIVQHAIATALSVEELEIMQERRLAANGEPVGWSPEQTKRIEAALDPISMEFTGRPFDEISSAPWEILKFAALRLSSCGKVRMEDGRAREMKK
jgi:hypothetical protein